MAGGGEVWPLSPLNNTHPAASSMRPRDPPPLPRGAERNIRPSPNSQRYIQEPRRPYQPYQPWRHPSRRAENRRSQKMTPMTFLNLDDNDTVSPEPGGEEDSERVGNEQTDSRWHAYNQQPWRHPMRRMSTRAAARSDNEPNVAEDNGVYGGPTTGVDPKDLTLEELRTQAMKYSKALKQKQKKLKNARKGNAQTDSDDDPKDLQKSQKYELSRFATELYTVSYLIFFAILGTLARIGLESLTFYPGAPVVFSELWGNFAGSLFMGYLIEDNKIFREEWGISHYHNALRRARERQGNLEAGNVTMSGPMVDPVDILAAKKAHGATKKTIPLYIGLATGFCGSFTTFGSFMRDCFLALSNDLPTPLNHPEDYSPIHASVDSTVHRNPGYSFMAVTAVILVTVALCMSGLFVGTHIAQFLHPYTPVLPFRFTRNILDPLAVVIGWGSWIGAVLMAIFPPDASYSSIETWRGQAIFAVVFGPVGCLMRFYISLLLNAKIPSFPLGTFVVNVFGTMVLGMSWDLQHVPLGGVVGCQVLQGIESGFCGCITTVSTWVSELSSLKKRHAYRYGIITVLVSLASLVAIMGGLRWTKGFAEVTCATA